MFLRGSARAGLCVFLRPESGSHRDLLVNGDSKGDKSDAVLVVRSKEQHESDELEQETGFDVQGPL